MAVPPLILKKGEILVYQGSSPLNIELQNSPFLNGAVALVSDLTDEYSVEDNVLFDPTNATKFKYDSVNYYLIKESDIKYKEIPPP